VSAVPWAPLEHTADLGIEVRAARLGELFVDAASGLCDAITDVGAVEPRRERGFELRAEALDLLMVAWLEELLYHFDTGGELYPAGHAKVAEEGSGGWSLRAHLRGETFDPARHPLKVAVKAITYHGLEVAEDAEGWRARVLFDI
jgi:SHS2 domain-containing protein